MNMKKMPDILVALSIVAVLVAAYDNLSKTDIMNLAGTQWILIGIVLGIYAMYLKMREKTV
jgi:hypothetical protein